MAVVTVVVVMTVMAVMVVVVMAMVMTVMTVMATAVHHVPTAAAALTAAAMTRFSGGGGESRHADSNRCGNDEDCSALEHTSGSLGCSAGAYPRSRASVSLKTQSVAVLAVTLRANANCESDAAPRGTWRGRARPLRRAIRP
jgi:hypothetical protein